MKLTKQGDAWVCVCSFYDRDIPKAAGFKWNSPVEKAWSTRDPRTASALIKYADADVVEELMAHLKASRSAVDASWAASSDFKPKAPDGLEYMPFQRAGIEYAIKRIAGGGGVLIACEMGLGKTIQAIGVINELHPSTVLIVCPASLKLNWRDEVKKWVVHPYDVTVVMPRSSITSIPGGSIFIVNYDILQRFEIILNHNWGMVVADESHYLRNPKTLRFKCFKNLKASARVALSGTPFTNRPIEIQTSLAWLRPDVFGNRMRFAMRYCGAVKDRFGWNMNGCTNASELNTLLRSTCMVRRLKADVLKELPPKVRQVIELPSDGMEMDVEAEWVAFNHHHEVAHRLQLALQMAKASESDTEYHCAVENLKAGVSAAFAEMALMRLKVAKAKVPFVLSHLEDIITPDHPVVCFAHHREVVHAIIAGSGGFKPVAITGDTPILKRHAYVKAFQGGESDLFVGNMQAAGVGLTLTRSSHVVFSELDWVPANLSQAEDRLHRISQHDSVLVQHLVLEGSLDAVMAKRVIEKQKVIDKVLNERVAVSDDEPVVEDENPLDIQPRAATASASRERIVAMANKLKPGDSQTIHQALRFIAGLDMDFARIKNNVGFNRLDAAIGHELAQLPSLTPKRAALGFRIARKYINQMSVELADKLKEIEV